MNVFNQTLNLSTFAIIEGGPKEKFNIEMPSSSKRISKAAAQWNSMLKLLGFRGLNASKLFKVH